MASQPQQISYADLTQILDYDALRKNGVGKVLEFLQDLKLGFDRGEEIIHLNIPFIIGENQNQNEYDLYLNPSLIPQSGNVIPSISLIKVVQLIDEIVVWTQAAGFSTNVTIDNALSNPVLTKSLLQIQKTITEDWLADKSQLDVITTQVELLLQIYQELSSSQITAGSLAAFILALEKADSVQLLRYWQLNSFNDQTVEGIIELFHQTEVGERVLPDESVTSVNQACLLANTYAERVDEIVREFETNKDLDSIKSEVGILRRPGFLFSVTDESSVKTKADNDHLIAYEIVIETIVQALLEDDFPTPVEEGVETKTRVPSDLSSAEADSDGEGQSEQEEVKQTPAPEPVVQQTNVGPVFGQGDSSVNQSVYRYQAISIHAGFLYNHVISNVYNLYGLPPGPLPPLLEYQLRQEIISYLYTLDPRQLAELNRFGRLALGENLFRNLIIKNPRIFIAIERIIQTTAAESGQQIPTVDPLHLEDRTAGFNREQFIRDIPQTTEQLETEDAQASLDHVTQSTTIEIYNLSLKKSDDSFKTGLQALGIDPIRSENIRRLILSYIQTSGLDPAYLLANRSPAEISALFDGVELKPDQVGLFLLLVESYWQYQMQKMQMVAGHTIRPEARTTVEASTGELKTESVISVIESSHELAQSVVTEGNNDIRLYTIASLSSTAQLSNPTYLRTVAENIRDLYNNDQAQIEQAIQTIIRIHAAQLASLRTEIAQNLEHRQLLGLQKQISPETTPDASAPPSTEAAATGRSKRPVPDSLTTFTALSLQERELIVEQLLSQNPRGNTPQQVFAATDYSWQTAALQSMGYTPPQFLIADQSGVSEDVSLPQLASNYADEFNDEYAADGFTPDQTQVVSAQTADSQSRSITDVFNQFRQTSQKATKTTKTVSRIKSLGSSLTKMNKTAAGVSNPVGSISSRIVGGAARAIFGEQVGGKIEQAVQNVGLISTIGGAISTAGGFLFGTALPLIAANLPLILLGGGITTALGGLAGFINSQLIQPVIGTPPPPTATPFGTVGTGSTLPGATQAGAAGLPAGTATPAAAAATPAPAAGSGIFAQLPNASVGTFATSAAIGGTIIVTSVATISSHGAFLSPLEVSLQPNEQSRFMSMTKVASPSSFENESTDKTVTYTITITPKPKEDGSGNYRIRVTQISDTFINMGQIAGQSQNPPEGTSPVAIGYQGLTGDFFDTPVTLTYSRDMSGAIDVLVQNTVDVDYDVEGEDTSTTPNLKATASVRIGNPQTGCFEFADTRSTPLVDGGPRTIKPWTEGDKNFILEAYLRRAGSNSTFNSLVCTGGTIKLYRLVEQVSYGGFRASDNELAFYDTSFGWGLSSVEYTLIHELGHILDDRNADKAPSFRSNGYTVATANSNTPCFTYPLSCSSREAFAEGIALYVVHSNYRFSTTWSGVYPFPSRNPSEYSWYKDNIFNGQEFL